MKITFLIATLLFGAVANAAAADAPLPFTPPTGWANMLAAVPMPKTKETWTGPGGAGSSSASVTVMTNAFAGDLDALVAQQQLGMTMMQARLTSPTNGEICAKPARFLTASKQIGPKMLTMAESVFIDMGTAYTITYAHDASRPADPLIEHAIMSLCSEQVDNGVVPALSPGWTSGSGSPLQMRGMWMSPSTLGSSMNLLVLTGPTVTLKDVSPEKFVNSTPGVPSTMKLHLDTKSDGTVCNLPAKFFSSHLTMSGVSMIMKQEAVLEGGAVYVLSYGRLDGQPEDPNAIAALKSLCPR